MPSCPAVWEAEGGCSGGTGGGKAAQKDITGEAGWETTKISATELMRPSARYASILRTVSSFASQALVQLQLVDDEHRSGAVVQHVG